MDFRTTISNLLTGTPQSQYAAIAILIAMIAIILSIVFNENELTLGERFMLIGSVILFSIPSIILGLFDLTCVSGKTLENSACWWWGWVISFIIIIICVIVVFASISSMLTYNVATSKSIKPVVDEDESNKIAKSLVKDNESSESTIKPKVAMPSHSDMTMQHNIQGTMGVQSVHPAEHYEEHNHENMFFSTLNENMEGQQQVEYFTENKKKHNTQLLEGFQGCEYQAV